VLSWNPKPTNSGAATAETAVVEGFSAIPSRCERSHC